LLPDRTPRNPRAMTIPGHFHGAGEIRLASVSPSAELVPLCGLPSAELIMATEGGRETLTIIENGEAFHRLVPAGRGVERLGTGFMFTEGPVWTNNGRIPALQ
jgi:hypothetical protein